MVQGRKGRKGRGWDMRGEEGQAEKERGGDRVFVSLNFR